MRGSRLEIPTIADGVATIATPTAARSHPINSPFVIGMGRLHIFLGGLARCSSAQSSSSRHGFTDRHTNFHSGLNYRGPHTCGEAALPG